jgi:hypothetical protein
MKLLSSVVLLLVAGHCHSLESRDLYDVVAQGSVSMPRADEESLHVQLQSPIHFFTEKYDSIYVSCSFPTSFSFPKPPKVPCALHHGAYL